MTGPMPPHSYNSSIDPIESPSSARISSDGDCDDRGDSDSLWYFAIGAMVNPISLRSRNIRPRRSRPAELLNHRIRFFGTIGVAEAVPDPDSSFHGVLHKVCKDTMAKLDLIERDYVRGKGTARCYDGTLVECVVYVRRPDRVSSSSAVAAAAAEDSPPLERYLDIMIMGCEYFGVSKSYVQFLRDHDSQPRPKPSEFRSTGRIPDGADTITMEEVEVADGTDGMPLYITMNGKVLECALEPGSRDWNEFVELHHSVGQVGEMYISRVAFDPKYGTPNRLEDFTREHSGYLEDLMCRYHEFTGLPHAWRVIGKFEQKYRDDR